MDITNPPRVRLYPDCLERHTSVILHGLMVLAQDRRISLEITTRLASDPRSYTKHTAWIELWMGGESRKLCFDMADWPQIASTDGLEQCDLYFKRSYSERAIALVDPHLQPKIKPFGLYYPIALPLNYNAFRLLGYYYIINGLFWRHPIEGFRYTWSELFKQATTKFGLPCGKDKPVLLDDLRAPPSTGHEGIIVYQARVWDRELATGIPPDALQAINDNRAVLVRTLRGAFGDRFRGGLIDTALSRRRYPDCISTLPTNRATYLREVGKAAVAIATTGLHNSIGAKLPEYMAAGRAILSEPLSYVVSPPLIESKNLLFFHSPKECVDLCDNLLSNPKLIAEMGHANHTYFTANLQPDHIVMSTLNDAVTT